MSSEAKPSNLVIVAGPNGSGKSTITASLQNHPSFPTNYINPDEIALTLPGQNLEKAYEAAKIAEDLRREYLQNRESFAFETVASHPSKFLFLREAKEAGYQTLLIFVGTQDPQINVQRVKQRAIAGGHDVPENKIIARYFRSMQFLVVGAEIASETRVFDNSSTPFEAARLTAGSITKLAPDVPDWVREMLVKPIIKRATEREEISNFVANYPSILTMASLNASYSGEIIELTDNYAIQRSEGSDLMLHDLRLLGGDISVGQSVRISYRDGLGTLTALEVPQILPPDLDLKSEQDLQQE